LSSANLIDWLWERVEGAMMRPDLVKGDKDEGEDKETSRQVFLCQTPSCESEEKDLKRMWADQIARRLLDWPEGAWSPKRKRASLQNNSDQFHRHTPRGNRERNYVWNQSWREEWVRTWPTNAPSKVVEESFVEVIISIGEVGDECGNQKSHHCAKDELYGEGKCGDVNWEEFALVQQGVDLFEQEFGGPTGGTRTCLLLRFLFTDGSGRRSPDAMGAMMVRRRWEMGEGIQEQSGEIDHGVESEGGWAQGALDQMSLTSDRSQDHTIAQKRRNCLWSLSLECRG
jgi:hypothetical protein